MRQENAICTACGEKYHAGKSENHAAQKEHLRCPACGSDGQVLEEDKTYEFLGEI